MKYKDKGTLLGTQVKNPSKSMFTSSGHQINLKNGSFHSNVTE